MYYYKLKKLNTIIYERSDEYNLTLLKKRSPCLVWSTKSTNLLLLDIVLQIYPNQYVIQVKYTIPSNAQKLID